MKNRTTAWYLRELSRLPAIWLTALVYYVLYFVLNRTEVIGKKNIPNAVGVEFASRHIAMNDAQPITLAAIKARDLIRPWNIPWNFAASENFAKHWWQRVLCSALKVYAVKRGREDPGALRAACRLVEESRILIFPGGGRESTAKKKQQFGARIGAGYIAIMTNATVVPVWIEGMDKICPGGIFSYRVGKKMKIIFGKPVKIYSKHDDDVSRREMAQDASDQIFQAIYELGDTNP